MTKLRRALFLDRDGVINIDHGYVHRSNEFEFTDGIFDLCEAACEGEFIVIIITNQAGIGRGYYTENQFNELTAWMCAKFLTYNVKIERVYFCPFHPVHGVGRYKKESCCRKPQPGMILRAAHDYELDLASSILVGDKLSDIQAGISAGVGCNILYMPNYEKTKLNESVIAVKKLTDVISFLI